MDGTSNDHLVRFLGDSADGMLFLEFYELRLIYCAN